MLPESNWNTPFVAIEENRRDLQFKKIIPLSELWNSSINVAQTNTSDKIWDEIFTQQDLSLKKAISESVSSTSFYNQLQNSCWQYGKSMAEKDWPTSNIDHPFDAFMAIISLKVGVLKNSDCFLLERKTKNACTFYWLSSPNESPELCMLYHELFRGYFYHLSKKLRIEIHSSILPSSNEKLKAWKFILLWID